tara:strand:- start:2057 stop:2215 length:159 start_codon:yes stop_codon:yes gene_type:complete
MIYSQEIINQYIQSLNKIEMIAYNIAKEDLDSSFDIVKSIGFQKWVKKYISR